MKKRNVAMDANDFDSRRGRDADQSDEHSQQFYLLVCAEATSSFVFLTTLFEILNYASPTFKRPRRRQAYLLSWIYFEISI